MADKTPKQYFDIFNSTYQGSGQCVAGFQHFCNWLGYPTIRTGTSPKRSAASNYGNSASLSSQIQKYFHRIDDVSKLQDGDWYISNGPGYWGHVAMFYRGQSFGQNQVGSGGGYRYTLKPFSIWKGTFICAYRAKIWGNAVFNSNGASSGFRKYNLSEDQLRGIAALCEEEQGSARGAASEASMLANRFELYGKDKRQATIWDTANSGWFAAKSRARLYAKNPSSAVYDAVKDVLINGNRKLPNYVDEHDYIGDIKSISTGNYRDATRFIQDQTVITNNMGASYIFYAWGDDSRIKGSNWGGVTDPFGYTKNAKARAQSMGLNGQVGQGSIPGDGSYAPLYSTQNDRNDATIREAAYMDAKGDKTLKDTKMPLSVINYTSALASMYSKPVTEDPSNVKSNSLNKLATTKKSGKVNTSKITPPLAKEMFDYLLKKGGSPAVICGILGNIYNDCGYKQDLIKLNGAGVGICNWTGTRKSDFFKFAPKWKTDGVTKQLDYMLHEISVSTNTSAMFKNSALVKEDVKKFSASKKLWNGSITIPDSLKQYRDLESYVKEGAIELTEESVVVATIIWMVDYDSPNPRQHNALSKRIPEARRLWNLLQFI